MLGIPAKIVIGFGCLGGVGAVSAGGYGIHQAVGGGNSKHIQITVS
nr:hypothetical protein [Candidatus Mycoplasma haematolamae]